MRTLSPGLAAHVAGEATTLCRCWSLTRRDGAVLGFTDHDRDLSFNDIVFRANAGLDAAEASSELGFATGGGEVLGALATSGLSEADLSRGLIDDARVSLWLVNWADPGQRTLLETGFVGEVKRSDSNFTAEVRGLGKAFDEERGRLYTANCSADLGDTRCGVTPGSSPATVVATDGRLSITAPALSDYGDGYLSGGRLVFTAGDNTGFATEIRSHRADGGTVVLQLWQAAPQPIAVGDAFTAQVGCDKRFATCSAKFGNGVNFRGFPHLPGNDFIIGGTGSGSPGAGPFDGGSLFR
ncbi:MAG: beta tubulin [Stutzerimonas stutzeri]|nr:MAG: beta tubulin [Stutzerimonas stutzeri]